MTAFQIEIQLTAVVVAVACSLVGVFLVLRRMALLSDAISHSILFGIILAFLVVEDLASPFLVISAALTGVLTVSLVELLSKTQLVKEDAAIALVFPVLFSIGVILISHYAGSIHIDTDAVLRGELALVPFERFSLFGVDLGPRAFCLMSGVLILNLLFVVVFFKELKLATFDAALAASLGFSPWIIHYSLTSLVSLTAVGAFDAVGSILVVALMIAPPAAAYLLTDRLSRMVVYSACFGVGSAIGGYWIAHFLDVSIAGCMASASGLLFGLSFLLAPERGIIAVARRRARLRWEFAQIALAIHLLNHEGTPEAYLECRVDTVHEHVHWEQPFLEKVVSQMLRRQLVLIDGQQLSLTDSGRTLAGQAMVN